MPPRGGTTPRPISPIAAQKISTKNRFASVIAAKVPLSTLKQASTKAQAVAGRSSDETDEQAYEDEYEEEQEGEDSEAERALASMTLLLVPQPPVEVLTIQIALNK